MKNKRMYLCFVSFLFSITSSFSYGKASISSNQMLGDSTEYPSSNLYLLKDINNQPLLAQLTKYKKDKTEGIQKNIKIHFYPSSIKASDSVMSVKGLVFNVGQNPNISKFSVLAEAIEMTKSDSLAEIKRFGGILYKNGKTSKPAKSYSGIIQPRFLKLYSNNYHMTKIQTRILTRIILQLKENK